MATNAKIEWKRHTVTAEGDELNIQNLHSLRNEQPIPVPQTALNTHKRYMILYPGLIDIPKETIVGKSQASQSQNSGLWRTAHARSQRVWHLFLLGARLATW